MIIGLSGYARSGKDTLADIFMEKYEFERVAFADPIRDFLYEIDPIIKESTHLKETVDKYGWEVAKSFPEVRRMLQATGVTARNLFGADFWVNLAMAKASSLKNVIITDVRFTNEADAIKAQGGEIWRVQRPGCGPINGHESETAMDGYPYDRIVVNDGGLADLEDYAYYAVA